MNVTSPAMDDFYSAVGEGYDILFQVNNAVDDGYMTVDHINNALDHVCDAVNDGGN